MSSTNWIVVSDGTGYQQILNLKKDKKIRWKKDSSLNLQEIKLKEEEIPDSCLPGYFRLDENKKIVQVTKEVLENMKKDLNWEEAKTSEDKTNADIQQVGEAQKMSTEQITEMKQQGAQADEIIDGLIKNNENFEKRTDFSKEKYIKRKKLKHDLLWKIERCTLANVFRHLQKLNPKDMM